MFLQAVSHASTYCHASCVREQGNGLGGPIAAAALCRLTALRVLALSHNMLKGQLPECMATMQQLIWLWMDDNRIHGPVSEFSQLGQFLKNVDNLNLASSKLKVLGLA